MRDLVSYVIAIGVSFLPTLTSFFFLSSPHQNQMQYSRWARTKVTFKTSRTDRLPIVDLATFQINRNMEFGLYIGRVCFS